MESQTLVVSYLAVMATIGSSLLAFIMWRITRKDKIIAVEREELKASLKGVYNDSRDGIREVEDRLESKVTIIKDTATALEKRVRTLEAQLITKEEVRSLLSERVGPIESSLRVVEKEIREVTIDINKELRDTATSITKEMWQGMNQLSKTIQGLSDNLNLMKGRMQSSERRIHDERDI